MKLIVNIGIKKENEFWEFDKNCRWYNFEYEEDFIDEIPDIEDHVVELSIGHLTDFETSELLRKEWKAFEKKHGEPLKFANFLRGVKNYFCTVYICSPVSPVYMKHYTVGVVAKKLGFSRQRVNQVVHEAPGSYQINDGGGTWLISDNDIAFLKERLKNKKKPGPKKKIKVDIQENTRPDHVL